MLDNLDEHASEGCWSYVVYLATFLLGSVRRYVVVGSLAHSWMAAHFTLVQLIGLGVFHLASLCISQRLCDFPALNLVVHSMRDRKIRSGIGGNHCWPSWDIRAQILCHFSLHFTHHSHIAGFPEDFRFNWTTRTSTLWFVALCCLPQRPEMDWWSASQIKHSSDWWQQAS